MIGILNYGMGNIGSVANMLRYIDCKFLIIENSEQLKNVEKVILPGVGRFDKAMENINAMPNMKNTLDYLALEKKIPMLGVCLGMQILTNFSEEGNVPGLGWIDGKTHKFKALNDMKIPHMGWNEVRIVQEHPVLADIQPGDEFYFVHSYFPKPQDSKAVLAVTDYEGDFTCAIGKDNYIGTQFHPEKSAQVGLQLLANFATWNGQC